MKRKNRTIISLILTLMVLLTTWYKPVSAATSGACPVCGAYGFDPIDDIEATCTEAGFISGYCRNCDTNRDNPYVSVSTPALGHQWGGWTTTLTGSCEWQGERVRYCNRCGEEQVENTGYGDHKWENWTTVRDSTCTTEGVRKRTCSTCGTEQTQNIGLKDHSYGSWQTRLAATCTSEGVRYRTCQVCGREQTDTIGMIAHSYSTWKNTKEATDHSTGTRERSCSVCGKTETEEFYPEGTVKRGDRGDAAKEVQELLADYGFLPAGSADGIYGSGTENAVKQFQESKGLEADGIVWPETLKHLRHNFGDWVIVKKATSLSIGLQERTCEDCGKVQQEEIVPEGILRRGDKGETVKELQTVLNEAGYDCGVVDGAFGGKTENAIKALEEKKGLEQDGIGWPGIPAFLGIGPREPLLEFPDSGTEMALQVVLLPTQETYEVGDTMFFDWYLTNTGTEPLSDLCLILAFCEHSSTMIELEGITLEPGEVIGSIFEQTILEEDYEYWHEERGFSSYSAYFIVKSFIPDDYPINSNTESVIVPMVGKVLPEQIPEQVEELPVSSAKLEVTSEYGDIRVSLDDVIELDVTFTNTGNTLIEFPSYNIWYEDGTHATGDRYANVSEQEVSPAWITPGDVFAGTLHIRVTQKDIEAGRVYRKFIEYGRTWISEVTGKPIIYGRPVEGDFISGEEFGTNEVIIEIPLKTEEPETEEPETDEPATEEFESEEFETEKFDTEEFETEELETEAALLVTLKKTAITIPANGEYYVPGETIQYELIMSNLSDEALLDPEISDPLKGSNEDAIVRIESTLAAGASLGVTFDYIVTEEDAQNGFVTNQALCTWFMGEYVYSEEVTVPAGPEKTDNVGEPASGGEDSSSEGYILFQKYYTNAPENGQFFTPNETILYTMYVENKSQVNYHDVEVSDWLKNDYSVGTKETLEAEDSAVFEFAYMLKESDIYGEWFENTAVLTAMDENDDFIVQVASVSVPVGMEKTEGRPDDGPMGFLTELTITKEETSTPKNGKYYAEGETIKYLITWENTGETTFSDIGIFDPNSDMGILRLATSTNFASGDKETCTATHKVTADDVNAGYVSNVAIAQYGEADGITSVLSDPVICSTGEKVPETSTIITGTVGKKTTQKKTEIGEKEPKENESELTVEGDTCQLTLNERTSDTAEFEQHYCSEHEETRKAVEAMVDVAKTPEEKLAAWHYARTLWEDDLNAMRKALMKDADGIAMAKIINEQILFYGQIASFETMLTEIYSDNPEIVQQKIAELLMRRCSELCYEINTAPSERADCMIGVAKKEAEVTKLTECIVEIKQLENGDFRIAESLCESHAKTAELVEMLLNDPEDPETAWNSAAILWKIELRKAYRAWGETLDLDTIKANQKTFEKWLETYRAFIELMYPEQPEIVEKMMARTIMNQVTEMCLLQTEK